MPLANDPSPDLTRTTLSIAAIGVLVVSTAWILRPFLTAFLWAGMIVISTWPLLLRLQAKLWGRRGVAATVLTLAFLLVVVIPVGVSVGALVANIDKIAGWVASLKNIPVPPPPKWLSNIPLAGHPILSAWQHAAIGGAGALGADVPSYGTRFIQWFAGQIGGLGGMVVQFLMTVVMTAVLYMKGESAARGIRKFAIRLSGPSGGKVVSLAGSTVRGVAMGVVVTALVQTAIAGVGLVVVSVPGALLLSAAVMFLCLAQLGPAIVMLPAVIWKFYTGSPVSGSILAVFGLVAMTIDNVLRPVLIRKGADLPLLLIFTGVIGGMISFGIMGIFVGPVIVAVTFTLLQDWVNRPEAEAAEAARPTA